MLPKGVTMSVITIVHHGSHFENSHIGLHETRFREQPEVKKIAVVIPVYNEENNIGSCMSHLLSQTVKPDTILIVNDGSTDNTVDVVEEIQKDFDGKSIHFCHLHRSSGYGLGYSRNLFIGTKWLDKQRNPYDLLMLLDADQRLAPDYIELCVAQFDPDTAIVGGVTRGTEFKPEQPRGAHRILSKEFLDKHPFPLTYATDSFHFYEAIQNGYKVKVVKDATAQEVRNRHASFFDNFCRGRECHLLGYSLQYIIGRAVKNSLNFKSPTPFLMIYGFLYSLLRVMLTGKRSQMAFANIACFGVIKSAKISLFIFSSPYYSLFRNVISSHPHQIPIHLPIMGKKQI